MKSIDTFGVGRKLVAVKAGIDAPRKPDPKKPMKGGKKKQRLFAYWLNEGLNAYEAYLKAGYQVKGTRAPSGEIWPQGMPIHKAQAFAQSLAESPHIQGWIAAWNIPTEHLLEQMKAESAFVLRKALQSRDENGNPTARAVNAADSILDRTGLGRGSKLALEHRTTKGTPGELEELKRQVLDAMRRDGAIDAEYEILQKPLLEANTCEQTSSTSSTATLTPPTSEMAGSG